MSKYELPSETAAETDMNGKLERRLTAAENAAAERQAETEGAGGICIVNDVGEVVSKSTGGDVIIVLPDKADPAEFALPSERRSGDTAA